MISLHGNWRYSASDNPDFAHPDYDDSAWPEMQIPQNWFLGGLDHHGVVWFRFEFTHRRTTACTHATLHFDGVDYFAEVFLNGEFIGKHTGYFEPFAFDVTKVLFSGKNVLAVRVDSPFEPVGLDGWHMRKKLIKGVLNHHDCRPGGGWEPQGQACNTGGIWNRVWLEGHDAVTIEQVLLRADLTSNPPVLHADLSVQNRTSKQETRLRVHCEPKNFKGKDFQASITFKLSPGESQHHVQIPVPGVEFWQPWDRGESNLYKVSLILETARPTSYETLFGFRTIHVDSCFNWKINGQRYFLRGSNYISSQWLSETLFPEVAGSLDHPFGTYPNLRPSTLKQRWFKRDIALAKQANLNILRVHAHVLPAEFYAACDQAGILVWQDFPFQWGYSDEPDFRAEAERQMAAMIHLHYNHPAIVTWCCHNESPSNAPWMAEQAGGAYDPAHNRDLDARLEQIAKNLDPSRYVHRNSSSGDGHVYPGWYYGQWQDYRDVPGAPFPTEYGAQGLPVRESLLKIFPRFGPDAGHAQMVRFKAWLETQGNYKVVLWSKKHLGPRVVNMENNPFFKPFVNWLKGWGIKVKGFPYTRIPPVDVTPSDLHVARKIWETWRFHDFQSQETFEDGRVTLGESLDEFVASSQAYQSHLIQYATEIYRRNKSDPEGGQKDKKVNGIFQFYFTDPWPAITWSVLDYWRVPKPAYDALRRAMQPVLPSFQLPEEMKAGKAILASFCIVNDLAQAFKGVKVEWLLKSSKSNKASKTFQLDVPADGISTSANVTLPSLEPGSYELSVKIASADGRLLGGNWYEITVNKPS